MTLVILVLSFAKLSSLNLGHLPPSIPWDKMAHFSMYFVLTYLLMHDFHNTKKRTSERWVFLLVCLAYPLLLGMITEVFQGLFFFPRTAEWLDWLSNTAGVFAGWGAFRIFNRRFKT